jgi:hypothetical protein
MFVPSSTYEPYSSFVPYFDPILVISSLDDESEDENTPSLAHLPLYYSIEYEPH